MFWSALLAKWKVRNKDINTAGLQRKIANIPLENVKGESFPVKQYWNILVQVNSRGYAPNYLYMGDLLPHPNFWLNFFLQCLLSKEAKIFSHFTNYCEGNKQHHSRILLNFQSKRFHLQIQKLESFLYGEINPGWVSTTEARLAVQCNSHCSATWLQG